MGIREPLDDHMLAGGDRQLEFSDLIGRAGYSVSLQAAGVGVAQPDVLPDPAKGASVSDTRCSRSGRRASEHATCGARTDIAFVRELPLAVALMEELLTRVPAGRAREGHEEGTEPWTTKR
jgi:hypothetical protein